MLLFISIITIRRGCAPLLYKSKFRYDVDMTKERGGFHVVADDGEVTLKAWGHTLEELFLQSLCGMSSLVSEHALKSSSKGRRVKEEITIQAVDVNSMLVEFLSEAASRITMGGIVFVGAEFGEFGEDFLSGTLEGVQVDELAREVHAVIDDSVDVKKNPDTGYFETMIGFVM